ncbi:MAG: hypothetical protein ACRD3T_06060 [Terriglobia bacterium]
MGEIQAPEEMARRAMVPGMTAFSMLDDKRLQAWRRRGDIETKIIFLCTLTIFISGLIAIALLYTKTAPPRRPTGMKDEDLSEQNIAQESEPEVAWLSAQLGLNADQAGKVRPIVDEEQRKINLAVADASLSSEARIAKVNQIRLWTLESLLPVLKAPQSARLQQLREQERAELHAVWDRSSETGKQ